MILVCVLVRVGPGDAPADPGPGRGPGDAPADPGPGRGPGDAPADPGPGRGPGDAPAAGYRLGWGSIPGSKKNPAKRG
jgi:hypothetical protein